MLWGSASPPAPWALSEPELFTMAAAHLRLARYYSTPLIPITPGFKHPAWPLALNSSKSPGPCLPLALLTAWRNGRGHVRGMKMSEELCAEGWPATPAVCSGLGTPFCASLEEDGLCLRLQTQGRDLIQPLLI